MSAKPRFVHLRTHTDFSMIDGIAKVKPLVKACAADNMVALALTDFTNFCGVVRFYGETLSSGLNRLLALMFMLKASYVVRNYSLSLYLLRTMKVIKTSHYCFQKPINVAMWIYLILTRSG
ncbi:DNA polymerase III subunit alpha [Haemophilus parainfluenzae]|uniref:DNA polymerase III subunit alpha n=1 Tax=Haemophilus parainfluenzae TaxID=729 RepID=A0A377JJR0_HAEPA|nr:DNA polymerase III subunit alpha [Haemophilus parainfluenzae]